MSAPDVRGARILIVDDEPENVRLLSRVLVGGGFENLVSTNDPDQVLPIFASGDLDLILLDLHMPRRDGFEVLQEIMPWVGNNSYLPILMLTGDSDPAIRDRALASGARDFLTKPFRGSEVLLRIRNLLETRFLHKQLAQHNQVLEAKVQERTSELEEARMETLARLARAAEYRDDETGEHTKRVGRTAALIARVLGRPDDEVELIARAAPLHDIGKIGVPDGILLKPGKLTPKEFEVMRAHTTIGASILSGSNVPLLQLAARTALTHHERWDGRGYPEGIAGEAIPLVGRVVAVADVFDALTHDRPYKNAWAVSEAIAEIEAQAGRQFDPVVVEAFLQIVQRLPA